MAVLSKAKKTKNNVSIYTETLESVRKIIKRKDQIQEKFNRILKLVAKSMNAEACSVYILRPGEILELFATYGLDEKAVHETYLRIGEGLSGEVALRRRPLHVENVWKHGGFVYKPETKELNLNSFAGVPIIHQNILLGVLSVQKKEIYTFKDDEIDFLTVVGMVLCESIIATHKDKGGKFVSARQHRKIDAVCLLEGIAIGHAFVHKRVELDTILACDKSDEEKKLKTALKKVEDEINQMLVRPDVTRDQEDIFKTYLLFAKDKGWIQKIKQAIDTGLSAQAGVQKVIDEMSERMKLMSDPYIKERVHDFQDFGSRIIKHLKGSQQKKTKKIPKNAILVAKSLGPVELLDYDSKQIKAIVLEEGSQTMHMTIVAKSLGIPILSGIKNVDGSILNDDILAVDAINGFLYVNPSDDVIDDFENKLKILKKHQQQYQSLKNLSPITLDNKKISLFINAGLPTDIANTKGFSFQGIGLYRTELPFMSTESLPNVNEQTEIYKRVFKEIDDKKIIFRTLDIGSDKILPYFDNKKEQNPAMGWRSIRITLDRRAILTTQLRALIRAADKKDLYIMFPMITNIKEFKEAKETLLLELEREKNKSGIEPKSVKIGTMIEVPSLLFVLDELVKYVDFVSIGTNDLAQFLFATDRSNPMMWGRYDTLSPVFLKVLKKINDACIKQGIPCSVCGEMASSGLDALALIAIGFENLSMNPSSLGQIKAVIRSMNKKETESFILSHLDDKQESLRDLIRSYAIDHNIMI